MAITAPLPWNGKAPPNRLELLRWHRAISPLKLDIVGDFAGKELFAIHGESLLAHCVREAKVDFDSMLRPLLLHVSSLLGVLANLRLDGFQLLHAVHAVEAFLYKLVKRGCNFHVLWFDQYEHLCIPRGVRTEHAYKYRLTRAVLMQHLANPTAQTAGSSRCSLQFQSLDCEAYREYLARNAVHFIMCSHGEATASEHDPVSLANLSIGYQVARAGYCVAFINDIDFQSSKVWLLSECDRGLRACADRCPGIHIDLHTGRRSQCSGPGPRQC